MPRYSLPIIQELRAVKTAREISFIIKAQRISETVLSAAVARLKSGVREITMARFIVAEFKCYGIEALAFEPIVSFGKNTANIHHEPGKARLRRGDTVMFDFGCTVEGYCSDMSRTYFFGQPSLKQQRVYLAVLKAQERALQALNRGERRAKVVDNSARAYLTKRFGRRAFPHGLGHGIGAAIHEWPSFKPGSPDVLKPGVVMTVEPGAYLKGWGGVRIEDMVVIQKRGVRNLTRVSKDLSSVILKSF